MSKKMYSLRIEEKLLKKLSEVAKDQNRSVSNLIETILMTYTKTTGKDAVRKQQ